MIKLPECQNITDSNCLFLPSHNYFINYMNIFPLSDLQTDRKTKEQQIKVQKTTSLAEVLTSY